MRTFKPMFDRVLVKMAQDKGLSAGGIYMPQSTSSNEGEVVEVGPLVTYLQPGDIVIIDRAEVRGISVNEPDLVLVKEENVLSTVQDAPNN